MLNSEAIHACGAWYTGQAMPASKATSFARPSRSEKLGHTLICSAYRYPVHIEALAVRRIRWLGSCVTTQLSRRLCSVKSTVTWKNRTRLPARVIVERGQGNFKQPVACASTSCYRGKSSVYCPSVSKVVADTQARQGHESGTGN